MTDELSGKSITQIVSTGPKSYSFKYGDDEQKSVIKAFTLNYENDDLFNHESLSKIVKKQIREIVIVNENKITRKSKEIVKKYCEKVFRFGYDIRVIRQINEDHINTLPLWLLRTHFPKNIGIQLGWRRYGPSFSFIQISVFIKLKKIYYHSFPLLKISFIP